MREFRHKFKKIRIFLLLVTLFTVVCFGDFPMRLLFDEGNLSDTKMGNAYSLSFNPDMVFNLLDMKSESPKEKIAGTFNAVTYNVAGLPEIISMSHPKTNIPIIGEKLNAYPLALLQEDFWYSDKLIQKSKHEFKAGSSLIGNVGDGLTLLSQYPILNHEKISWEKCSGYFSHAADCLTPKGFSLTGIEIQHGIFLHVYNVHFDAGRFDADVTARRAQVEQLIAYVKTHSAKNPIIIGGDFNMEVASGTHPQDQETLSLLKKELNVSDVCEKEKCTGDKFDRFLYRGNTKLDLQANGWNIPKGFVDNHGESLSDHNPIEVTFSYRTKPDRLGIK